MAPFVLALVAAGWFCFPQPAAAGRFWQLRYVAAGGLALAFLQCVASLVTGGRFLFFLPEWRYTFTVSKQNIYFMPVREYLSTAYWLVYPALTLCAIGSLWSLYPLWRGTLKPEHKRIVLLVHMQFLFATAHLVLLSTIFHQSVLQFPQIVMPLAAPMMPAIAAVLFVAERHRKLPDGLLLGAVITAIMLGVPWLVTLSDKALFGVRFAHTFAPLARAPLLMPLLLSTICIVYQVLLAHLRYAVAGTAICFAAVNSFAFPYPTPLSRDAAGCVNRDAFDAIVEANQFLTRLASSREANRIIYSFAEHLTDGAGHDIFLSKVFNSVGASRFCPRIYDWVNLTRWEAREFSSLKQIAILSSLKNEEPFTQEFGEAKRHGIPFGLTARKQCSRGRIVFTISILARMAPR